MLFHVVLPVQRVIQRHDETLNGPEVVVEVVEVVEVVRDVESLADVLQKNASRAQ
jgi:hypothetical protein